MSEKSYVSVGQKMCLITGKPYENGEILLDTRLKASLDRHTLTGWGICPEAKEKLDSGFIAFIGMDPSKSTLDSKGLTSLEGVWRTGAVLYIKKEAATNLFPDYDMSRGWLFMEEKAIEEIIKMTENNG